MTQTKTPLNNGQMKNKAEKLKAFIANENIEPKDIINFIQSDTVWFMVGLTKDEHKRFINKIKIENTCMLHS